MVFSHVFRVGYLLSKNSFNNKNDLSCPLFRKSRSLLMIKISSLLGLITSCLVLNGCAKSILDSDEARCPFVDRGGCQSMERVNQMVTQKRFTPDGQFVQQANSAPCYAWRKGC